MCFNRVQIEKQDALMDQSLDQIMGGVSLLHFPLLNHYSLCGVLHRCDVLLADLFHQVMKLKAIALDISTEVKTQGRLVCTPPETSSTPRVFVAVLRRITLRPRGHDQRNRPKARINRCHARVHWAGALNRTRPSQLSALAATFKPNIGD